MERKRGRPTRSAIRQNIVEILAVRKKAYGYELYKYYCDIFPKPTLRVIYYHLKKGVARGEFEVEAVKQEAGDYSWGKSAEKIYYKLGAAASAIGDHRVAHYFSKKNK